MDNEQDVGSYRRLGKKTLWIFVMDRINTAVIFLLISVALFSIGSQPFFDKGVLAGMAGGVSIAAWIALALFVLSAVIAFVVSWLIYVNFKFMLGDDALKISRGVFSKTEEAIPYRQIEDVDIERSLSDRMMGVSRLVILTSGREDEKDGKDESEGVLPVLDRALAEQLQAELLKRTDVQKVVEEK